MSSAFRDSLRDTRVYALTDREISGLSHAQQVSIAAQAGISIIQLREKTLSSREFYEEAVAAVEVARQHKVQLIINDRVDIAAILKTGLHLGQDDLPPHAARAILGPEAIIGFSTHSLEQAEAAMKMPLDYVAIGPIFSSSTKAANSLELGVEGLRELRRASTKPLVAIGGVTLTSSSALISAGADAVAVIRDIWASSQSPEERIRRFIEETAQ